MVVVVVVVCVSWKGDGVGGGGWESAMQITVVVGRVNCRVLLQPNSLLFVFGNNYSWRRATVDFSFESLKELSSAGGGVR